MFTGDLVEQFSSWDQRTRGYRVWPLRVELEPPFAPFIAQPSAPIDDGRRPGLFEALFAKPRPAPPEVEPESSEPLAHPGLVDPLHLRLILPSTFEPPPQVIPDFLVSLSHLSAPVCFELIGTPERISLQLSCARTDAVLLRQNARAFYPEVRLAEELEHPAEQASWNFGMAFEFGLLESWYRPLATYSGRLPDPLTSVIEALGYCRDHEILLLQVLFQHAVEAWPHEYIPILEQAEDAQRALGISRQKFFEPLFAAVVRVVSFASRPERCFELLKPLVHNVTAATRSEYNELLALENDGYDVDEHIVDVTDYATHRSGMLLGVSELAHLVHVPSLTVRAERLERDYRKTRRAPEFDTGIVLGINEHEGEEYIVRLPSSERLKHTYVIGASGTGKSTLLTSLILQDIENGSGCAVLDPHGDLIDDILGRVPASRLDDVILLDPSDEEHPIPINILKAYSNVEKTLLSSDLVGIFQRLATSWGDQMTAVLGNAVMAFLESDAGGTLIDLKRFLVEDDFRAEFLKTVEDSEVVYFWTKEFPLISGRPQASILTRLNAFLRPKVIRNIVAAKARSLDFAEVLSSQKILLAKLSQGVIGVENAYLLGSILVAKLQQMAVARQTQSFAERDDFFLYVDEFHNFITPSISSLLAGVRKYRMGLVLAHQNLAQLGGRGDELSQAVLANASTRVCFRVSEADARVLSEGFSHFEPPDLTNLGTGEAICRIGRADADFNLGTKQIDSVSNHSERRNEVIARSRANYTATLEPEPLTPPTPAVSPEVRSVSEEGVHKPEAEKPFARESIAPPPEPTPPATSTQIAHEAEPRAPGRGGAEHKYLQSLIRQAAETHGFRVTLEKPVLAGAGFVDAALERDDVSIGCEICVTNTLDYEISNAAKCLSASFDYAALVIPDPKKLKLAKKRAEAEFETTQRDRLIVVSPEEFIAVLATLPKKGESTVRGYKVKTTFQVASDDQAKARKKAVTDVIVSSLKKLRTKK